MTCSQLPQPGTVQGCCKRNINADFGSSIEIKTEKDLLPPGAEPGTVPTDLEQATGLERLEILGKMQGIDIFDMSPLPSDRKGMSELRSSPLALLWQQIAIRKTHGSQKLTCFF